MIAVGEKSGDYAMLERARKALSSIAVATATPPSSALHMRKSSCVDIADTYAVLETRLKCAKDTLKYELTYNCEKKQYKSTIKRTYKKRERIIGLKCKRKVKRIIHKFYFIVHFAWNRTLQTITRFPERVKSSANCDENLVESLWGML